MIYSTYMANLPDTRTAPRVGNRRVYGQDTIQRLAKTPTAKYLKIGKTMKERAWAEQIQDGYLTSSSTHKLPGYPRPISNKSSEYLQNEEFAGHVSQRDEAGHSLTSVSTVLPVDSQKPKHSELHAKHPCPYKSLDAILFVPKYPVPVRGSVKKLKESPLPEVRSTGTKGDKCKSVKSTTVKKIESQDDANYTFFRQDSKESKKSCEQFKSALLDGQMSLKEAELAELQECEFFLSERLEFLLRALHHEQDSGRAFRKYLEKSKREDWMNNLDFWEKVQEYRRLFYKDKIDLHLITKNARSIFSQCIVEGAPQSISVSKHIRLFILEHLSPPSEDLFDRAEENALKVLFEAFRLYIYQDVKSYCEVERAVSQRRLETRNTYILDLQKQGIIKERPLTPDDPMEGYVDPVYDDSVLTKVPEQFKNLNMAFLAENKLELEYFRQFLIPRCAEIDLKCWMDMESWRQTAPDDRALRDQRAVEIKKNYLNKKYFFGPNSPAGKDGQNKVMEVGGGWGKFLEDKPHFNSILRAQKYVTARLEKKHLPFFLLSKDFQERNQIDSNRTDESEDSFSFNRSRSAELMKVISEGRHAFKTAIEKKKTLYVDLGYESPKESIIITGEVKEGSIHSGSARSLLPAYPVLPPISPKLEKLSVTSKEPHTPPQLQTTEPSTTSAEVLVKDASSTLKRASVKESTMSTKGDKLARLKSKTSAYTRWDVMLQKHSHLKPMGLIEYVSSVPSTITEQLMESKWISAVREIFLLQRALKNPIACAQFKKFVSLSGGFLENDILFWLEVQRYKNMHHNHTQETLLQRKVNAIINCFINSFLPPSLQIDIPEQMAENILEHRHELSPYLFRQAQMTVFRHLIPHWVTFHEYHIKLASEERVFATLPRHRAVALIKQQKYRERLAQEREAERQYRLLHPAEAEGDDEHHTLSFTYSDFLAQQEIDTEQRRRLFDVKSTQTVRSRDSSKISLTASDLDMIESAAELASILDGSQDFDFRPQIGGRKSSVITSVMSRLTKVDEGVTESTQRVINAQIVQPVSIKQ